MIAWVIQYAEELAVRNRHDLFNDDELLFVERFDNNNYFYAALHEGRITGVSQDNNDQEYDNEDDYANTNEEPEGSHEITLDLAAARGEITGVSPQ